MDTNIKYLVDNNINIWNKDAYNKYLKVSKYHNSGIDFKSFIDYIKKGDLYYEGCSYKLGDLGRVYGAQLRDWTKEYNSVEGFRSIGIDQFAELIHTLKTNPMATKKTVTFWNPAEKDECALTPCHWSFEILVEPIHWKSRLNKLEELGATWESKTNIMDVLKKWKIPEYKFILKWHQHSVDTFLGLPFNIASYALLAQIIGKMTNMVPKGIIGDLSNVHIYEPHLEAVKEQLSRNVDKYDKCELKIDSHTIHDLEATQLKHIDNSNIIIQNFNLTNYTSYPRIPAEMLAYNK